MMDLLHFVGLLVLYGVSKSIGQSDEFSKVTAKIGLSILQNGNLSENQIFSPAAIGLSLGMLYTGANGQTKSQLSALFNGLTDQTVNQMAKAMLYRYSEKHNPSDFYNISYAFRLYASNKANIQKEYRSNLLNYYESEIVSVDFENNAESVLKDINAYIEQQTNHEMVDFMDENLTDAKMVLINAIYLQNSWKNKFDESNTQKKMFFTTDNENNMIDMMNQNDTPFYYFEDDQVQVIGLPYVVEKDRERAMFIILPMKRFSLNDVVSTMTVNRFQELLKNGSERPIQELYLPRFNLNTLLTSTDAFKKLGLTNMFDPKKADFSGIDGTNDLYLSDFINKISMEVDENGTKAFTAGGGIRHRIIARPVVFNANQPFLFTIIEQSSLSVLFMGRYNSQQ